ncbi:chord family protein [Plasmopara halstedii]|uniref:Chord family protein n=3 Tax=Plasmopara halstedii TaxID=4781 RepID=A0A0N7L5F1_PLAHL|nr:chord family protein [Plasmopara halstedii]CEG41299.1 chord family protein [Plasmopara halstedii]|eukprot:XP_024577668.1 chord family protein [Plasmopara halstedii]
MHYEDGTEVQTLTLKMVLPSKWAGHTVDYLKDFFVEHYNTKKPENVLDATEMHLEKKGNAILFGDELLHTAVQKYDDLFLKPGKSMPKPVRAQNSAASVTSDAKYKQCKNHGCQKKYLEEENSDQACRHHSLPPLFHDMKKGWQCCSSKMVYDWDDFEKIEPCVTGRHSDVGPNEKFAASPTVAAAENAAANSASATVPPASSLKSIEDYNQKNPDAVTAVSAAKSSQTAPPPKRTDGKANCVNYGCQQEYVVVENTDTSCKHHAGPPVFHDAGKFWSCCPKDVKYDFDSFLKVPGCVVSAHTDIKTA